MSDMDSPSAAGDQPAPSRTAGDPAQPAADADPHRPPGESASPPGASQARRRPRWGRRIAAVIAGLLVLLILLVALVPTLISTGPGTSLAARIASGSVDGSVTIERLSVGWFSGTQVHGAVVTDHEGRRVIEVGELRSGLTLWNALRGRYDLGDSYSRLTLAIVEVDEEGHTNLHRLFRIEPDPEAVLELPWLRGRVRLDGGAMVQYVPTAGQPAPPTWVDFSETQLTFAPEGRIEDEIRLAFTVAGEDAGRITADGFVDTSVISAERAIPAARQRVELIGVNAGAIDALLAALQVMPYRLGGMLEGVFDLDTEERRLDGRLSGRGIAVLPVEEGVGYETAVLELAVNGTIDEAFRWITVNQLRVEADDGTAEVAGRIDGYALGLGEEEVDLPAVWPGLARDVRLDVRTEFATASGGGPSLGELDLTFTGDAGRLRERFGDLLGPMVVAAVLDGTLRTRPETVAEVGETIVVSTEVNARRVSIRDTAEPEKPPLVLSHVQLVSNGVLRTGPAARSEAGEARETGPVLVRADMRLLADNAGHQRLLIAEIDAAEIDAETGSVGRLLLRRLHVPDYLRAQQALAGWVDLPEAERSPGAVIVRGSLAWDGPESRVRIVDPLVVNNADAELVRVSGAMKLNDDETYELEQVTLEANDLQALNAFLEPLGMELSGRQPARGRIAAAVNGTYSGERGFDARADVDAYAATLEGATITGHLPLLLSGMSFAVTDDAPSLEVNGGVARFAGASFDAEAFRLNVPSGEVLQNVSLNPIILEVFGQFVNPAFVQAAQATGLLDINLTEPVNLNLADPLGTEGGTLGVSFSIRQMRIRNDVIREIAQPVVSRLNAVPAINVTLPASADLVRGNIVDATVLLRNGTVSSDLTFNVADPRVAPEEREPTDLYPVRVHGGVHMATLQQDLTLHVPRSLLDQWFGDQAWLRAFPDGVEARMTGTTTRPRLEAGEIIDRAIRSAVQEGIRGNLQDQLQDRLRGLFQ